ncbi:MAG: hypothetical protein AAFQ47_11460 [Pseudomonadota bacterium]
MSDQTDQYAPAYSKAVSSLATIAAEKASSYPQKVRDSFVPVMARFIEMSTSTQAADGHFQLKDPSHHKRLVKSHLAIAGLSATQADALYRDTLSAYASNVSDLSSTLEQVAEPIIDTLTCSLKAVHHHPDSAGEWLSRYVAPANEERDGWRWEVADAGNRFYHQRANVYRHDRYMFALFFDLKLEQEQHDYVMLDCVQGDAHETWMWLRRYVDEFQIAVSRVDTALDIHSEDGFGVLLSICQAHRIAWSKSSIPAYGSINMDNATAGRTAYFGKIPMKTGTRTGTFTVRLYDKGLETLQRLGADAMSNYTSDEIRNWSRIECSASPATAAEKEAMAANLAKDVYAAWGYRAYTAELLERILGVAVNRVKALPKEVKSPQARKEWFFRQYRRFFAEHYDGESVHHLLEDLLLISGVRLDCYGFLENMTPPLDGDLDREADYLEAREVFEIASTKEERKRCAKIREEKGASQRDANAALSAGEMPSRSTSLPPVPATEDEVDARLKVIRRRKTEAARSFLEHEAAYFARECAMIHDDEPSFCREMIWYHLIDQIGDTITLDEFEAAMLRYADVMAYKGVDVILLHAFHAACGGEYIDILYPEPAE